MLATLFGGRWEEGQPRDADMNVYVDWDPEVCMSVCVCVGVMEGGSACFPCASSVHPSLGPRLRVRVCVCVCAVLRAAAALPPHTANILGRLPPAPRWRAQGARRVGFMCVYSVLSFVCICCGSYLCCSPY
jgi:hypothetical protein